MSRVSSASFAQAARDAAEADEEAVRALDEQERLWSDARGVNNPRCRSFANRGEVLDQVRRGLIRYATCEQRIEEIRRNGDVRIGTGAEEVVPRGDALRAGKTLPRRITNTSKVENTTWRMIARHAKVVLVNRAPTLT